jgi:hypothetical protein
MITILTRRIHDIKIASNTEQTIYQNQNEWPSNANMIKPLYRSQSGGSHSNCPNKYICRDMIFDDAVYIAHTPSEDMPCLHLMVTHFDFDK